ncbi:hypothetical protein FRC04_012119 [Tulasnella sp. 424]|nr:hypothetical protein FRC04_012119 [Tulasnella sp. 424]
MGLLRAALIVGGGVAVAPAVAVGALDSVAAGIQATVYGGAVGAGSLFAMAQSAAMGGTRIAVSAAQTVGGALVIMAAALI